MLVAQAFPARRGLSKFPDRLAGLVIGGLYIIPDDSSTVCLPPMNISTAGLPQAEMAVEKSTPGGRAALLIAHPGHELAVHGWLEKTRPDVFVLTDGSGRSGMSRIHSSSKVLQSAGAMPGAIYGRYSETDVYRALLEQKTDLFVSLTEELAQALIQGSFDSVAGDMAEGFNPVHDVWRMMINTAVAKVKRQTGKELSNYDFSLFNRQDVHDVPGQVGARVELDASAFMRKLAASQSYPELLPEIAAAIYGKMDDPIFTHPALKERVQKLLGSLGLDAFHVEFLRQLADCQNEEVNPVQDPPFYEIYGETLVTEGRYASVLRYSTHLLPVADALLRVAQGSSAGDDRVADSF
jgi:hypothetical protein